MILRPRKYHIFILFFLSDVVHAGSTFECHVQINGTKFDLTSLGGERHINRTRETPPTIRVDSLRFDLCKDLTQLEGIGEHDQVCLCQAFWYLRRVLVNDACLLLSSVPWEQEHV
jgi:hypothetical protein